MQFSRSTVLKVASLLVAASSVPVSAFWRLPCRHRSGLARVDPLVNFGTVSDHAHAIHGSSGFSETSVYSDLMGGECTSCQVAQDKSVYWTPTVYFKNSATGEFQMVEQVGGMLAYYLLYPNAGETTVTAFPEGFQMISGDTNRRNFTAGPIPDNPKSDWTAAQSTQDSLAQKALGFNCLNYAGTAEGSLYRHFLPNKTYLDANCPDGVRLELMFPSCWNGKDVDSPNHKDHVAFPSEVMTGTCPDEFPVRLISLFYETIWNTAAFIGTDGEFVISNGDPTGYGYHGDFIMGWDRDFLQEAADTCTNASGEIEDCSLFTIQDGSDCNFTMPSLLDSEDVLGPLSTLPGNPIIAYGPEPASEGLGGAIGSLVSSVGTALIPTQSYSSGSSIASSGTFVPGGIFIESSTTAAVSSTASSTSSSSPSSPTSSSTTSSTALQIEAPATTAAPSLAAEPQESFYSTSWSTSGREVLEVFWVEETVTVTEQSTSTATSYIKRSEAPHRRNRHLHRHIGH